MPVKTRKGFPPLLERDVRFTGSLPRAAREWLDGIRLDEEFRCRVPTMRSVPAFLAPGIRRAFVAALTEVQAAHGQAGEQRVLRAWKLFFLLPRLLLTPSQQTGPQGRSCLLRRLELFRLGEWRELHRQSRLVQVPPPPVEGPNDTAHEDSRASKACALVRRGELSRARQVLTAAQLAPGTEETYQALADPARRPPERMRDIPPEVLAHRPEEELALTVKQVADALRSSKRGSAAVLSGATVEMYKLLLDEAAALDLFTFAVNCIARADAPAEVLDALALSRLTALRKPQGGVRGIATGDVFRRLVSRVLARLYADAFETATRPFQFALQTRAGATAWRLCCAQL